MGSILNFVFGNNNILGEHLKNEYDNYLFRKSVIGNYIDTSFYTTTKNFEIKKDVKNIFVLECNHGLNDFYTKNIDDNKTVLETFPSNILEELRNNENCKLLISSLAEATELSDKILTGIEDELIKHNIDTEKVILVESNKLYETQTKFKSYSPLHFLNDGGINDGDITELNYQYKTISEEDLKLDELRKYHFICLNRNTQKYHRYFLLLFLVQNNLLDKTLTSALRKVERINDNVFNYLNESLDFLNKLIPIEIDTKSIENKMGFRTIDAIRKKDYLNSYINLVTETCYEQNAIFFTEKIGKPIIGLQPFIVLSAPNYLKELQKLGFKTFHPFIDETYDSEVDDKKRLDLIFKEIKRLSNMDLNTINNLYKSVLHICIYNKKRLEELSKISPIDETIKTIKNEW